MPCSARWDYNSSLNFETGWAHLFKSTFSKETANAPDKEDINYFYMLSMLRL